MLIVGTGSVKPTLFRRWIQATLQKAIRTVGHTGTWEQSLNAWGDLPSWAVGVNLLSNGESIEPRIPRLER